MLLMVIFIDKIIDPKYLSFSQLQIACACISISREVFKLKEGWPQIMETIFKVKFDDFKTCMEAVKM